MTTAQREHLKELIDELPDAAAAEIERLLVLMTSANDEYEWHKLASATFNSWFTDEEYEYPDDAGRAPE